MIVAVLGGQADEVGVLRPVVLVDGLVAAHHVDYVWGLLGRVELRVVQQLSTPIEVDPRPGCY